MTPDRHTQIAGWQTPTTTPRIEHMFDSMGAAGQVLLPAAPGHDWADAAALLRRARTEQAAARRAEVGLLECAVAWAHLHPSVDGTEGADDAAAFFDVSGPEPISGAGTPGVAEFSVAEFGSELGLATGAAKRLIGHGLELVHRLPRLWSRVVAGEVDPWRARRVAESTIHAHPRLTAEAAAWVDAQVAPHAGRVGPAQVERLLATAIERFRLEGDPDPEVDEVVEALHVTISGDGLAFAGTVDVTATLTTADGLDLEHALRSGAEAFAALGSTEPLGARRSRALGQIARRQTSFDLSFDDGPDAYDEATGTTTGRTRLIPARRLDLHLHFAATAGPTGDVAPTGFLENGQQLVRLEQLKAWLGDDLTELRVLPVLDLSEPLSTSSYVPSPRLRRQVQLRDGTCVFPWCARPSRSCDLDHVVPYDTVRAVGASPPQTRTENLASLCRSHHRLKTHGRWHLTSPASGVFVWTSPHGHRYRRDRSGTERVDPEHCPHPLVREA